LLDSDVFSNDSIGFIVCLAGVWQVDYRFISAGHHQKTRKDKCLVMTTTTDERKERD